MVNELLFIISVVAGICFTFFAARRGLNYLLCFIAVNLILGSVFGGKFFSVFGFVANIGNIFYACVFLATGYIVEKYGRPEAIKTIWLGASSLLFFIVMSRLSVDFVGLPSNDVVNTAIQNIFTYSIRIASASLLSFIFAQYLNIRLYEYIKLKTHKKFLWLRVIGANTIAQLLDSVLFFTIAFPSLAGPVLLKAIFVGWFVKSIVVLVGTPLFYIAMYIENKYD